MAHTKKCPECQTDNELNAKFCFECGSILPEHATTGKYCPACGVENTAEAKFCAECGNLLSSGNRVKKERKNSSVVTSRGKTGQKKQKSQKGRAGRARRTQHQQHRQGWNPKVIGLLALGVVLFVVYAAYINQKAAKISEPYVEQISANFALEAQVREVASKFVCACGSCPREPLESCSCPTARKERDFIRNALASGQSADQVITVLNNQFGGLKSAQSANRKDDLTLLPPPVLSGNTLGGAESGRDGDVLASFVHRQQIIEQFSCPCGQCAIDKLKDCNCDHPRGAQEVKKYIDDQIAAGTYTVAQIIEKVDNQYGGRIR
jgi:cytochrome c-type biogenesis protein CcmH/NrfF